MRALGLIVAALPLAVTDTANAAAAALALAEQQRTCAAAPFDLTEWRRLCDAAMAAGEYEMTLLACLGVIEMEGAGAAPLVAMSTLAGSSSASYTSVSARTQRQRFEAYVLSAVQHAAAVDSAEERDAAFDTLATLHGHLATEAWIDGADGAAAWDHATYAFHLGAEDGHSVWPVSCAARDSTQDDTRRVLTRLLPSLPAEALQSATSRWLAAALLTADREESAFLAALERGDGAGGVDAESGPTLLLPRGGVASRRGRVTAAALRALRARECSVPFVRATLRAWVLRSARGSDRRDAALRAWHGASDSAPVAAVAAAAAEEEEAAAAGEEREPWNRYEVPMQHLPQHVVDDVVAAALGAPGGGAPEQLGTLEVPRASPTPVPPPQRRRYSVNNFAYGALYAQSLARAMVGALDVDSASALLGLRPSLAARCDAEKGGVAPGVRAARRALHAHVAQMQRAPDATAGVLVLGANVGSEAMLLHWALSGRARVVGVELLPHLVAIAREVQAAHLRPQAGADDAAAPAAPLEFRCGDALDIDVAEAVPRSSSALTLIYVDDDSWDDALVSAVYAKLSRELPAGRRTLLVSWHGASAATANATEWALLGGFPVDASWAHSCRPAVFVRELRRA